MPGCGQLQGLLGPLQCSSKLLLHARSRTGKPTLLSTSPQWRHAYSWTRQHERPVGVRVMRRQAAGRQAYLRAQLFSWSRLCSPSPPACHCPSSMAACLLSARTSAGCCKYSSSKWNNGRCCACPAAWYGRCCRQAQPNCSHNQPAATLCQQSLDGWTTCPSWVPGRATSTC